MELTNKVYLIASTLIMGAVSIIHLCFTTCKIVEEDISRCYECEEVSLTKNVQFQHDLSEYLLYGELFLLV